jgi:hypothetical protein
MSTHATDQKKPKSESYLSMMASKTTKMASRTTKMAKKKLKRARSSLEIKPKSASSIFGSQRRSRTTTASVEEEKPKSTSYLLLGSPPMTPHSNRKIENFLNKEAVDAESVASLRLLDTEIHQEQDSIADSAWLPSTQEKTNSSEIISGLGRFFSAEGSKDESALTTQRGDEHSIMTSDESIKERFLNETAEIVHSMEGNTEPSLVELVAHVQTMSGLLQRQTFRLQNKLSGRVVNKSDKTVGKDSSKIIREIPHGTKELCREVESLFENCDDTLAKAFSRLDADDADHPKRNQALDDYRKTFSLEKTFLDKLRKGVTSVLANHNAVSITLDNHHHHHEEEEDVISSSSGLFHKLGSTFGQNDSEGSIFDESRLSIVFEDHSIPSDQPKPQHGRQNKPFW